MVGSKLNCTLGKQEEKKMGGEWGKSKGMPVNILNKGLFRTVYWIPVYPLIGGLWIVTPVNARALVTLMRNAIWRERDICYPIMWTLKLLQTTQLNISCMSNLFVMSRKFA